MEITLTNIFLLLVGGVLLGFCAWVAYLWHCLCQARKQDARFDALQKIYVKSEGRYNNYLSRTRRNPDEDAERFEAAVQAKLAMNRAHSLMSEIMKMPSLWPKERAEKEWKIAEFKKEVEAFSEYMELVSPVVIPLFG